MIINGFNILKNYDQVLMYLNRAKEILLKNKLT